MPPTQAVGTLGWTRQTRGIMRNRDRLALLGQACAHGLATLPYLASKWFTRRAPFDE